LVRAVANKVHGSNVISGTSPRIRGEASFIPSVTPWLRRGLARPHPAGCDASGL